MSCNPLWVTKQNLNMEGDKPPRTRDLSVDCGRPHRIVAGWLNRLLGSVCAKLYFQILVEVFQHFFRMVAKPVISIKPMGCFF